MEDLLAIKKYSQQISDWLYIGELNEDNTLEGKIHDARVAIKRMRASWRVFRPITIFRPLALEQNEVLAANIRQMGATRDRDVIRKRLFNYMDFGETAEKELFKKVFFDLFSGEDENSHSEEDLKQLQACQQAIECSHQAILNLTFETTESPLMFSLKKYFKRLEKKSVLGKKKMDEGFPDDVIFHDLRKIVKNLLYQEEILAWKTGEEQTELYVLLKKISDNLGKSHDLVNLISWVEEKEYVLDVKNILFPQIVDFNQSALNLFHEIVAKGYYSNFTSC